MNNNIREDYCSFEVSKLLKEKGYRNPYDASYWKGELTVMTPWYDFPNDEERYLKYERYYAPTHYLTLKWIRKNFKIHVEILSSHFKVGTYVEKEGYIFKLMCNERGSYLDINGYQNRISEKFSTPEKATEEAIKYVLKKFNYKP